MSAVYPVNQLFWYRILFMAELIIAETLFVFRLKRRKKFTLRAAAGILLSFAFAFAVPCVHINAAYRSFMFFSMFAFTLAMLKLCFSESFKTLLFCGVAAYTTQHISYELYNLIYIILDINGGVPVSVYGSGDTLEFFRDPVAMLNYFWGHAVTYWAMLVLFGNRIKRGESIELKSIPMFVMVVIVLIVDIVLGSVITAYGGEYNRFFMFWLGAYNIGVGLCMLYIQFTHLLVRRLTGELDSEKRLRRLEEEQFKLSRDNIELINLKCHDLKHQIRTIAEQSEKLDPKIISEMENAISIYDAMFITGNSALDTVLTEKNLVCNKNGISLTCCADEGVLSFMSDADIYSLFGNALDNAIEATAPLESTCRIIDIKIKKRGKMQAVNIRNYYDGKLVFDGDLPKTTKANDGYHGFGLLSITQTVSRYGGTVDVTTDEDVFTVDILFPTT